MSIPDDAELEELVSTRAEREARGSQLADAVRLAIALEGRVDAESLEAAARALREVAS